MPCECCGRDLQWRLRDEYDKKVVYRVCSNCLPFLTTYSLTPQMFRNLIKAGHKVTEFLLHDDFYDDEGNALQSMFER